MQQNIEKEKFGETLPKPPLEKEAEVDAAAEQFTQLDLEERRLKFQQQEVAGLQESSAGEMTALQAIQALIDSNRQAVEGEQKELVGRSEAQTKFGNEATKIANKSDQMSQKHQSKATGLENFTASFVELMGMVPSMILGNASEGSSAARKVQDGYNDAGQALTKSGEAAQAAEAQNAEWGKKTEAARSSFEESNQELLLLQDLTTTCEGDTSSGKEYLGQTSADIEKKLQNINEEKQAQRDRQEQAIQALTSWAEEHKSIRASGEEALSERLDEAEEGLSAGEERDGQTGGMTSSEAPMSVAAP